MGETVFYEGKSLLEYGLRPGTIFLGALGELLGFWETEWVGEDSNKNSSGYNPNIITNGWYKAAIKICNVQKGF